MSDEVISAELREFIRTNIHSIAHVEALVLLRDTPSLTWNAAALAARIYVSETTAVAVLRHLEERGLIEAREENGYAIVSKGPQSVMVERIANAYRRYLIPVTNLIHDRQGWVPAFADVFRCPREE